MTDSTPLPPDLENFVNQQLASGRFQSANELIVSALQLFKQYSPPNQSLKIRPNSNVEHGPSTNQPTIPSQPYRPELRERLRPGDIQDRFLPTHSAQRRSPRGILSDLRSHISFDDILEARREVWSSFPHGPS